MPHHLDWHAPVPLEDASKQLPSQSGVFIFCLPADQRYFAHYVGQARALPSEISRHIHDYVKGKSWLHDLDETERQDRLGRSLYNPENRQACFDPPMQTLAQRWVQKLVVFATVAQVPLGDIEGALAWTFRKDPRHDFTRYCDMCHHVKQKGVSATLLTHSFQGARVEGL